MLIVLSSRSTINMLGLSLTFASNQPLGSLRQDGSLHKMLPWREARRLELGASESEWYALSTVNFASISTKGSMKEAIAQLQLEGQLAEVAEHAVARQGLSVASMAK